MSGKKKFITPTHRSGFVFIIDLCSIQPVLCTGLYGTLMRRHIGQRTPCNIASSSLKQRRAHDIDLLSSWLEGRPHTAQLYIEIYPATSFVILKPLNRESDASRIISDVLKSTTAVGGRRKENICDALDVLNNTKKKNFVQRSCIKIVCVSVLYILLAFCLLQRRYALHIEWRPI